MKNTGVQMTSAFFSIFFSEKLLTNTPLYGKIIGLEIQASGSGGTGRRARLRGVWFTPYEFKSRLPHHKEADRFIPICFFACVEFVLELVSFFAKQEKERARQK